MSGLNREYRLLTREEEAEAWDKGDYNSVVEGIMPMVLAKVRTAAGVEYGPEFDRYLSEAHLSITHSLKTFDPSKGRFITYALKMLPFKFSHIKRTLRREALRGDLYQISDDLVRECGKLSVEFARIDEMDGYWLVLRAMETACSAREIEVIRRRLEGETLASIGRSLQITKERVRQIGKEARAKCREQLDYDCRLRSVPGAQAATLWRSAGDEDPDDALTQGEAAGRAAHSREEPTGSGKACRTLGTKSHTLPNSSSSGRSNSRASWRSDSAASRSRRSAW